MDSPRVDDLKARIRLCPECEHRMSDAAVAMRRHGSQMTSAIEWVKTTTLPTEEELQKRAASVRESFNNAQLAWDAYREHLRHHGLI